MQVFETLSLCLMGFQCYIVSHRNESPHFSLMGLCVFNGALFATLNGARSILLCMGKQKNESSTQLGFNGALSASHVFNGSFVYCKNVLMGDWFEWGYGY